MSRCSSDFYGLKSYLIYVLEFVCQLAENVKLVNSASTAEVYCC